MRIFDGLSENPSAILEKRRYRQRRTLGGCAGIGRCSGRTLERITRRHERRRKTGALGNRDRLCFARGRYGVGRGDDQNHRAAGKRRGVIAGRDCQFRDCVLSKARYQARNSARCPDAVA